MVFPEGKTHNQLSIHLNGYNRDTMEGSGFVLISWILIAKPCQPVHCGISVLIAYIFLSVLFFTFWLIISSQIFDYHATWYIDSPCMSYSVSWSLHKANTSVCLQWVVTKFLTGQEYHSCYLAVTSKSSNTSHLGKWVKATLVKRLSEYPNAKVPVVFWQFL